MQNNPILYLVCFILASFLYIISHWQGIVISPDGWAYWQGAVSLAENGRYALFNGETIKHWPPLYSIYLAAWVMIGGSNGLTLTAANGSLVVIQAMVWLFTIQYLFKYEFKQAGIITRLMIVLYICLSAVFFQKAPLAHIMLYIFVPLSLCCFKKLVDSMENLSLYKAFGLLLVVNTLIMLTHNSGLAFLFTTSVMTYIFMSTDFAKKVILSMLNIAIPGAVWYGIRNYLGQSGSHPFRPKFEIHQILDKAHEIFHGFGSLLIPDILILPYLVSLAMMVFMGYVFVKSNGKKALGMVYIYILLAVVFLAATFLSTNIHDPLRGRFIFFMIMFLIPTLLLHTDNMHKYLKVAVILLLLMPQLYWNVKSTHFYLVNDVDRFFYPERFVTHNAYIEPGFVDMPPVKTEKGILISPLILN